MTSLRNRSRLALLLGQTALIACTLKRIGFPCRCGGSIRPDELDVWHKVPAQVHPLPGRRFAWQICREGRTKLVLANRDGFDAVTRKGFACKSRRATMRFAKVSITKAT